MQKIGIGYENYKEFIEENLYYVDKTMLVQDLLEKGGKATLFTRPRRFGKTLALSMLQTFFELEYDEEGREIDKSRYFEGKKIMEAPAKILSMMGQYPVIKLSLKSANQSDYRTAILRLRDEIVSEFGRHGYLLESKVLDSISQKTIRSLMDFRPEEDIHNEAELMAEAGRYTTALKVLSHCLEQHHKKKVIILIDEYDVPLESAYVHGFYNEMVGFIRSLFESALKTNEALFKGVITGCLRISRERLFTGLNNLNIDSIRSAAFDEAFGFTESEVFAMLEDYGIGDRMPEAKKWYDGYTFGEKEIYNPWSITKYVKSLIVEKKRFPEPYWINTSSNSIIRDLIYYADEEIKDELDTLISGGTIEKRVHEEITYTDIHESADNLWNFLFFTGYLKKVSERLEDNAIFVTLTIPNEEIRSIYINQIGDWFKKRVKESDRSALFKAVLEDDPEAMTKYINDLLQKTISTFDSSESFYHGFFLSLLSGIPGYKVRSNREEGDGRPDLVLYPTRVHDKAIIFEVKVRKKFNEMEEGITKAFRQIRELRYDEGILNDGYAGCLAYGICFCKKSCMVKRYPS